MEAKEHRSAIYDVTVEDGDRLGIKTEILAAMFRSIHSKARQLAPKELENEISISQDGTIKTNFRVRVSSKMAPYLLTAIQQQSEEGYGIAVRSYLHKLQEQIMAQMFVGVKDVIG